MIFYGLILSLFVTIAADNTPNQYPPIQPHHRNLIGGSKSWTRRFKELEHSHCCKGHKPKCNEGEYARCCPIGLWACPTGGHVTCRHGFDQIIHVSKYRQNFFLRACKPEKKML